MELPLCEYGCGQPAPHQIKNGKWCCSKSPNSCPAVKERSKQTFRERYGVDNIQELPEVRKKNRLRAIKRINNSLDNGHQINPNYNPAGCKLIDAYGEQNGYTFQHAENGGEFHIKELGYWVDGYDEGRNTIIEVDEAHHFDSDGNLTERDIRRQTEIVEYLGCDFIRIKI